VLDAALLGAGPIHHITSARRLMGSTRLWKETHTLIEDVVHIVSSSFCCLMNLSPRSSYMLPQSYDTDRRGTSRTTVVTLPTSNARLIFEPIQHLKEVELTAALAVSTVKTCWFNDLEHSASWLVNRIFPLRRSRTSPLPPALNTSTIDPSTHALPRKAERIANTPEKETSGTW
jgi:hypothetical protein